MGRSVSDGCSLRNSIMSASFTFPSADYGAALAVGFRAARGDIVVNFDVDYYDLAFLDSALRILEEDESVVLVVG